FWLYSGTGVAIPAQHRSGGAEYEAHLGRVSRARDKNVIDSACYHWDDESQHEANEDKYRKNFVTRARCKPRQTIEVATRAVFKGQHAGISA
ncbi:hypothetical protein DOJ57_23650, partial [Salmonella enterica subsp. enterica serovar Hvittingfoss]|nr:hypothetical protein [Salmonella enterica subsp. enterica serovar Hvittingfoss]